MFKTKFKQSRNDLWSEYMQLKPAQFTLNTLSRYANTISFLFLPNNPADSNLRYVFRSAVLVHVMCFSLSLLPFSMACVWLFFLLAPMCTQELFRPAFRQSLSLGADYVLRWLNLLSNVGIGVQGRKEAVRESTGCPKQTRAKIPVLTFIILPSQVRKLIFLQHFYPNIL